MRPPHRVAAFDLGSNSLKLTIVDARDDALTILHESETITRIAEGADRSGQLLDIAIERSLSGLAMQAETAREFGAETLIAAATAGLRGVRGGDAFLHRARTEAGVELEVISGRREALLAYRAATDPRIAGPRRGRALVLDVGGRSTELALGGGPRPEWLRSLEMGGVTLFERFVDSDPPRRASLEALDRETQSFLQRAELPALSSPDRLVGLSGTVLALAGAALELDTLAALRSAQPVVLTLGTVTEVAERWARQPRRERAVSELLPPGRSDVVVAASRWVRALLAHFDRDLEVSTASLGLGLALECLDGGRAARAP